MKAAFQRLSPRKKSYVMAGGIALVSLLAGYGLSLLGSDVGSGDTGAGGQTGAAGCEEVSYWYDPMKPDQHFDKPGKSPFMDMQLVAKCAGGDSAASGGVTIDPTLVQNFGVRTAQAEIGVLELDTNVTGTLAYNSREVSIAQPRASGFVQRTYGLAPDDIIAKGAPVADLLIPEWGGAQREYLAVAATGDQALTRAARERMRLLGMPDGVISSVARSGSPRSTITITAPTSGAITTLSVRPGMSVTTGQTLAEITGLNPIWLEAAVPEILAGDVRVGQTVSATLTAFPDERFAGRVTAILPSAQAASRTLTVRAELRNPNLRLRPGMFAQVSLAPARREAVLIPSEAVIRTGDRVLTMLAQEKGGYRPAEIRIGREAGGRTEVLAGLAAGEKVVISGQFLLDSEASLAGLDVRGIDEVPVPQEGGKAPANKQKSDTGYKATGAIESITARSVTLRHGPVPALEWPAMTMTFATSGPAQLRGFKRGDKVNFRFEQKDGGPRITAISKRSGQ